MEGRGVTNYATGKPSYGFSTTTTEYDDALISRGIVTFDQSMVAKGASPKEARRLAELNENGKDVSPSGLDRNVENNRSNLHQLGDCREGLYDSSSEDETEQFMRNYRRMRINDMKKGRAAEYGDVMPISRPEWNREVNEASRDGLWVLVNLTRGSSSLSRTHDEICDKIETITRDLAEKFLQVKFVAIPSTLAIDNWPPENLPTLFCYRYGKMQHQLIGAESLGGAGVTSGRLEWRLAKLGVLKTDLEEDPRPGRIEIRANTGRSQFGGEMSRLATRRDDDSIGDYDDVD